jgi:hypothetical protein
VANLDQLQKDNERLQATVDSFDVVMENWQSLYEQSRQETKNVRKNLYRLIGKLWLCYAACIIFGISLGFIVGYYS